MHLNHIEHLPFSLTMREPCYRLGPLTLYGFPRETPQVLSVLGHVRGQWKCLSQSASNAISDHRKYAS